MQNKICNILFKLPFLVHIYQYFEKIGCFFIMKAYKISLILQLFFKHSYHGKRFI
ncbi:hypothetical protein C8P70_10140 [Myroides indicus]|uniref:Uncharacterized protein n=1 Tax=Myroides indicus TaxID=1323422 RepID=A0A4R7FBW4_9FLAO|nr:hypothetical protein C8P70_10140 [Myroides indicus]